MASTICHCKCFYCIRQKRGGDAEELGGIERRTTEEKFKLKNQIVKGEGDGVWKEQHNR